MATPATRRLARCRSLLGAMAPLVLVAACSTTQASEFTASHPVFAGLDTAVVEEVLSSPAARQRVEGDDPSTAQARYQGMVRNFTACRSALKVYQEWLATGVAPSFPPQPTPANPASTAADMDRDIERLTKDAASGDISLLRADITNPSGCGAWIPANPGDADGPTVADVVNGKS